MPRRKSKSRRVRRPQPEVVVIGAGAFGGWTAYHLLDLGARVTLVDAWGAGHLRGTSSDESRVIRCGYGPKTIYSEWAWRALALWKKFEKEIRTPLFVPAGVLWLCAEENDYARATLATLRRLQAPTERMNAAAMARRFPQFRYEGISFGYLEPKAGYLRARVATQAVAETVKQAGGRVVVANAEAPEQTGDPAGRPYGKLRLSDGSTIEAEHFVFACGPWLPQLFPALLGKRILVTRQEVFYFGPPPGAVARFAPPAMPVWLDPGPHYYGIASADARGVKVADDWSGPPFDPTSGERNASAEGLQAARDYLRLRLPALADAPLLEARVCQYERTPDSHLVIDRHPDYANVWIIGGGSGHGFKQGPALGEFVARHVLGRRADPIPSAMRIGASEWPAGTTRPAVSSL